MRTPSVNKTVVVACKSAACIASPDQRDIHAKIVPKSGKLTNQIHCE